MSHFQDILTYDDVPTTLRTDGGTTAKVLRLDTRGERSEFQVGDGITDTWIYSVMLLDSYIEPKLGERAYLHPMGAGRAFIIELLRCEDLGNGTFYCTFRGHVTN